MSELTNNKSGYIVMIGMGIAAGVQGAAGLASTISAAVQARKQLQMAEEFRANNPRPTYEIPESQMKSLEIARQLSTMGLPGVQATQELMGESTSAGVRSLQDAAQDPASLLASISGLYSQQSKQGMQLGITDAQARLANIAGLQGALGTQAQYEDKAFQINQMEPYMQAAQAAGALEQAGLTNRQNAISGATSLIGGLASAAGGMADYGAARKASTFTASGSGMSDFYKTIGGGGGMLAPNTTTNNQFMPTDPLAPINYTLPNYFGG